jgi:hypothetical protein
MDWQMESTEMASVYGNAYLVIAASNAAESSIGLLLKKIAISTLKYLLHT